MLKKLILGLTAIFTLAACSSDEPASSGSIVGTWNWDVNNEVISPNETERPETISFFADGTVIFQTVDIATGAKRFDYYDYRLESGRFNITDHHTGERFMTGAYVVKNNELTLNNYTYLRQPEPDTQKWGEMIVGTWAGTEAVDDSYVVSFLTFNNDGSGSEQKTITGSNAKPESTFERFNFWVKRNYLIREYDTGYTVSVISSFGIFGKSLTIDNKPYTLQ